MPSSPMKRNNTFTYIISQIVTLTLTIASTICSHAQELNCRVEVNVNQIEGTNKSIFESLQEAMTEYVNTFKWTDTNFSPNEKIEATMFLSLTGYNESSGKMMGTLQVQSIRPVYNSSYTTTLLNFKDNIEFSYTENEPLIHSENTMESQLTAILDYYANLILALDFDSFSLHGGDPYFERLKAIVQRAQSSGENGWKNFEDTRNRAAVLDVFTNPTTSGIRDLYYTYHLKGLDQMALSPDKGRVTIDGTLDIMNRINDLAPMSVGISMFKDTKFEELLNIYSHSTPPQLAHLCQTLTKLYPSESRRIEEFKKEIASK